MRPATAYARNGDVHLAYQCVGEGPMDVMFVPGFVSHLEMQWRFPEWRAQIERLAGHARVIRYDKRGTGLSDRDALYGTLEERVDDVVAVLDAAGSTRATLVGISEGGPLCAAFAATHPGRTRGLVLAGTWSALLRTSTNPEGIDPELFQMSVDFMIDNWGTGRALGTFFTHEERDAMIDTLAELERQAASPGAIERIWSMIADTDVSGVLCAIRAPTLVLHSPEDRSIPVRLGEKLATQIPGAAFERLSGSHGDIATLGGFVARVDEFVTGTRSAASSERVLYTLLFTDIVQSTRRAAELGDAKWRLLLDQHDQMVRECVASARGRFVKQTGDGALSSFDGPARAVRCAQEIMQRAAKLGLTLRAGLHTGECERRGDDLGGIAVHVAARVMDMAGGGEVLCTRTVVDLVAGAGLSFSDRGEFELNGVPERWRLYSVEP
jgi:pimeloyl-ACP methyl ester carboxylesterase